MSLLFIDGFDDGLASLGKWESTNTINIVTVPRTGTWGCQLNSSGDQLTKIVKTADKHATFSVGFAFRKTAGAANDLLRFCSDDTATTHITLGVDANFAIVVKRGVAGTTLGTSANNVLVLNTYAHVEILVTLSDTVGIITVNVNGVNVLSLTSQDTKNAGTATTFDSIKFVGGGDFCLDDIYLTNGAGSSNTGLLGDCIIETLLPSGNGTHSLLVGSDADSINNYLLVDEIGALGVPNTSDYTASATVGDVDSYAMGNLASVDGTIYGVQTAAYAAKNGAGPSTMLGLFKLGGTSYTGLPFVPHSLTTGYWTHTDIFNASPATSLPWTVAGINAAELGGGPSTP